MRMSKHNVWCICSTVRGSHRASTIRVVGRNEKSELEESSMIEASSDDHQTIPDCKRGI